MFCDEHHVSAGFYPEGCRVSPSEICLLLLVRTVSVFCQGGSRVDAGKQRGFSFERHIGVNIVFFDGGYFSMERSYAGVAVYHER